MWVCHFDHSAGIYQAEQMMPREWIAPDGSYPNPVIPAEAGIQGGYGILAFEFVKKAVIGWITVALFSLAPLAGRGSG